MAKELLFMSTHCNIHTATGRATFTVKGITQEVDKANFFFYLSGSTLVVIDRNNNVHSVTNQYLIVNKDLLEFVTP